MYVLIKYQIDIVEQELNTIMKNGKSKNKIKKQPDHQYITPGNDLPKMPSKHQLSSNDKEHVRNFLAKLELGDLCFSDIIQYGFALFGQTKAGKTTLAHHLVKNILAVVPTPDRPAYILDPKSNPQRLAQAVIGMKNQSETVIPNSCEIQQIRIDNKKAVLLDCPGYSDSKGPFLIITNAYFHFRIFSKVRNLKFILTFDSNTLTGSYQKPARTIQYFLKSFKDISKIKRQIIDATVFYFTKSNEQKEKNIIDNLQCIRQRAKAILAGAPKYSEAAVQLIDSVISQKKYFFFRQAGDRIYRTRVGQDQLRAIHGKTKFWSRQLCDQTHEVDMTHIKFAVGRQLQGSSQFQTSEKQFEMLCTESAQRFSEALGTVTSSNPYNLKNILHTILNNSISGALNFRQTLTQNLQQFVKLFYNFGGLAEESGNLKQYYQQKRNEVKKRIVSHEGPVNSYSVDWIQELQISNLIIQFVQEHFYMLDKGFPRQVEFFIQISEKILKIISQIKSISYFPPRSDQEKDYGILVENFCYTIYRLLEEAKIFKIIFAYDNSDFGYEIKYTDKTVVIYDIVTSLCNETYSFSQRQDPMIFHKAKLNYVTNAMAVKINQPLSYYNEIQKYCKSIQLSNSSSQLNQKIRQINQFKISSKLTNPTFHMKIASLINNVRVSKQNILLTRSLKEEEIYIEYMNQLGDELSKPIIEPRGDSKSTQLIADPEITRRHLINAIKVYKKVSNVYRAIEVYKFLKTLYIENDSLNELKVIICQFAEYAATHGRRQLAIENLQHAYYLIDMINKKSNHQDYGTKRAEKERLAQKIGLLGLDQRYDPSQSYYDSMLNKQFSQLIDQRQLAQIQRMLQIQR